MDAVVTGAAGFIGSHVCERLLEEGATVHAIDKFDSYYSQALKQHNLEQIRARANDTDFSFVKGDVSSDKLRALPQDPDVVFHLAAIGGVRKSVTNPVKYFQENVQTTVHALDYFESSRFVFSSSSSVYGNSPVPAVETDELSPTVPYALTKVQAESLIAFWEEHYGVDPVVLRYFSVYGPRQRPDEAITKFCYQALTEQPITVYGDGDQTRDFTHVSDVAAATVNAAGTDVCGIFNIGTGRAVAVNQIVDIIADRLDRPVQRTHCEQPAADVDHTLADISKAESALDYRPQVDIEDGVHSALSWCKDNLSRLAEHYD